MELVKSLLLNPNTLWFIVGVFWLTFVVNTIKYVKYYPLFARWFILNIINFIFTIISMFVLSWFLPLAAIGASHLPWWLSYFDTLDNTLDGDLGYINEHAPFKGIGNTGIKQYINRCMWLFRNPAYGFGIKVMGKTINELPIVIFGDPLISDGANFTTGRTTGLSGNVFIVGKGCFEYYSVQQKGNGPTCNRIRLGWKLSGFINELESFPLGTNAQFVCTFKFGSKFTN